MMLGGFGSTLHREGPWEKPWRLAKDGGLWKQFQNSVKNKTPNAVKLTKAKGHTTKEMVEVGQVREGDRKGNNEADGAAGKGPN